MKEKLTRKELLERYIVAQTKKADAIFNQTCELDEKAELSDRAKKIVSFCNEANFLQNEEIKSLFVKSFELLLEEKIKKYVGIDKKTLSRDMFNLHGAAIKLTGNDNSHSYPLNVVVLTYGNLGNTTCIDYNGKIGNNATPTPKFTQIATKKEINSFVNSCAVEAVIKALNLDVYYEIAKIVEE